MKSSDYMVCHWVWYAQGVSHLPTRSSIQLIKTFYGQKNHEKIATYSGAIDWNVRFDDIRSKWRSNEWHHQGNNDESTNDPHYSKQLGVQCAWNAVSVADKWGGTNMGFSSQQCQQMIWALFNKCCQVTVLWWSEGWIFIRHCQISIQFIGSCELQLLLT